MAQQTRKSGRVGNETPRERAPENIVHEYPALGRYRIRVIHKDSGTSPHHAIDVREYVSSDKFEGFTRRGIRLSGQEDVNRLRDSLADAIARGWFDHPQTG